MVTFHKSFVERFDGRGVTAVAHKKPTPAIRVRKKGLQKPKPPLEKVVQSMAEQYLQLKRMRYIRIPDAAYKSIFANEHVSIRTKAEIKQALSGVPDLIVLSPSARYNDCLLLELKREKGTIRDSQTAWHEGLNVVVAYGFDEAKRAIDEFHSFTTTRRT